MPVDERRHVWSRFTLDLGRRLGDRWTAAGKGFVYSVVVLLAAMAVVGRSNLTWSSGYMIGPSAGGLSVGDHLQSTYYLWLWSDALTHWSHFPWVDPYQFALTGHAIYQAFGWPLVLLSIPVQAISGPVAAYNVIMLVAFVAAGGCTYLLGRALGLSRVASGVAGFAYVFAPYRLIQQGHANSLLAFMLPLILLCAERALYGERSVSVWAWACVVAYLSLVASGEMHLAFYGTGLFVCFVTFRTIGVPSRRLRSLLVPAVAVVVGASVLVAIVYIYVIGPSGRETAVSVSPGTAPRLANLFARTHGTKHYAYPGIMTTVLGVAGAAVLLRHRAHRRLGALFVTIVVGAYLLAMAPSWPPAFAVYRAIPFMGFNRLPGRILIAAALGLAILAGWGVTLLERRRWGWLMIVVILAAIVTDAAQVTNYQYTRAGGDVLAAVPRGAAILDLPTFHPSQHPASRYMLELTRNPGPRVGGYYILASPDVFRIVAGATTLVESPVLPCVWKEAHQTYGFEFVAVHLNLFGRKPLWPADGQALMESLERTAGFHRVSRIDEVVVFRLKPEELDC